LHIQVICSFLQTVLIDGIQSTVSNSFVPASCTLQQVDYEDLYK